MSKGITSWEKNCPNVPASLIQLATKVWERNLGY